MAEKNSSSPPTSQPSFGVKPSGQGDKSAQIPEIIGDIPSPEQSSANQTRSEIIKKFSQDSLNKYTNITATQSNKAHILASQISADAIQWATALEQSNSQNPAMFDRLSPDAKVFDVKVGETTNISFADTPVVKITLDSKKITKVSRQGNDYILTADDGTVVLLKDLIGAAIKSPPVILTEDGKVLFADELILSLNNVAKLGPLAVIDQNQADKENQLLEAQNAAKENADVDYTPSDGTILGDGNQFLTPDADIRSQGQIATRIIKPVALENKNNSTINLGDEEELIKLIAEEAPINKAPENIEQAPQNNENTEAKPQDAENHQTTQREFVITQNPINIRETKFFDGGNKIGFIPQKGAVITDNVELIYENDPDVVLANQAYNFTKQDQAITGFVGRNLANASNVAQNIVKVGFTQDLINPVAVDPIAEPPPRQNLGVLSEVNFFPIPNAFVREDILPIPQKILTITSAGNIFAIDPNDTNAEAATSILSISDKRITLGGGVNTFNRINYSLSATYGEAIFGDYGFSFIENGDASNEPTILRNIPVFRAPLNIDFQAANFSPLLIDITISGVPSGSTLKAKSGNSFIDIDGIVYQGGVYKFSVDKTSIKNIYLDNLTQIDPAPQIKISGAANGISATPLTLPVEYSGFSDGNDFITGGNFGERIFGEGGNDIIIGGTGDDLIYGGAGDDKISDNGGIDLINAGAGNDRVLLGQDGKNDRILLGAGDDTLYLNLTNASDFANDMLDFGEGSDRLVVNYEKTFLQQGLIKNGLAIYSILQLQDYIYNQNRGFKLNQDLSGNYIFPGLGIKINPNSLEKISLNGPMVMLGSFTDALKNKYSSNVPYNPSAIFNSFNQSDVNANKFVIEFPQGLNISFTGGVKGADSKFTLSSANNDANAMQFIADTNNFANANFKLTLTAYSVDNNAIATRVQEVFPVPYAAPQFSLKESQTAMESTGFSILYDVQNQEGFTAENLKIYGFPKGIKPLNAAFTALIDGGYQLDGAFVQNIANNSVNLNAIPFSDDDYQLTFVLNSRDNFGNQLARVQTTLIKVNPIANDVFVNLTTAVITEDVVAVISLNYCLVDNDGSETFQVIVRAAPQITLSAQNLLNFNSYVDYTLSVSDFRELKITPPLNSNESFSLIFTYITRELNDPDVTFMRTVIRNYSVKAVADTASFTYAVNNITKEDTATFLSFRAGLFDTDGSESFFYVVSGVPSGATLDRGTLVDGKYTLSDREIQVLRTRFLPPKDYSGTVQLVVSAIAIEQINNNTAVISRGLSVIISPVTDTPAIFDDQANNPNFNRGIYSDGLFVRTQEDTPIALNVHQNFLTSDKDGSETIDKFILTGIPQGVQIITGSKIIEVFSTSEVFEILGADINSLEILPKPHSDSNFTFQVTAVAREKIGTTTALVASNYKVFVQGLADGVVVVGNDARFPAGREDFVLDLSLHVQFIDTDGSEEITSLVIRGTQGNKIPSGSVLFFRGRSQVLTYDFEDNVTFDRFDTGTFPGTGNVLNLSGLQILPPKDYDGQFGVVISINAKELRSDSVKTTSVALNVAITPIADTPFFNVKAGTGIEDTPISITIFSIALEDKNTSNRPYASESIKYLISGFPQGTSFNKGRLGGNNNWILGYDDISGLLLSPAPNDGVSGGAAFVLTILAQSTEQNDSNQFVFSAFNLPIFIKPVTDTPVVSIAQNLSTSEDTAVLLKLAARVTDLSETINRIIFNVVPTGGTILGSAVQSSMVDGKQFFFVANPQLIDYQDIRFIAPKDLASVEYTIKATVLNFDVGVASLATVVETTVKVVPVADIPSVNISNDSAFEDTRIYFSINPKITDIDGSEFIEKIIISGIPTFTKLHNRDDDATSVGTYFEGQYTIDKTEIDKLFFLPRPHSNANITLKITAISVENLNNLSRNSAVEQRIIQVTGITDPFSLSANNAIFYEDTKMPFSVSINFIDNDGSEQIDSIIIKNVPTGAQFTQGISFGANGWKMTGGEYGAGAQFIPSPHTASAFYLTISVTTSEKSNTASTQVQEVLVNYNVKPVADTARVIFKSTTTSENASFALNLSISLVDESEFINKIILSGIPSGYRLYDTRAKSLADSAFADSAAVNGVISLPVGVEIAVLSALGFKLDTITNERKNWDGQWSLTVSVQTTDGVDPFNPFYRANVAKVIPINVVAVAGTVLVSIASVNTPEDRVFQVPIKLSFLDQDGSERLQSIIVHPIYAKTPSVSQRNLLINGLPADPALGWQFTPENLNKIFLTPPNNSDDDISLAVTIVTFEVNNPTKFGLNSQNFLINVNAVVDTPAVIQIDGLNAIFEDGKNEITFKTRLTDTDGSEKVKWVVRGIPDGASWSGSNYIQFGNAYTFFPTNNDSRADFQSVARLILPLNSDFTFNLIISTVVTESLGNIDFVRTQNMAIKVNSVADVPDFDIFAQTTLENSPFGITVHLSLFDNDGSETVFYNLNTNNVGIQFNKGFTIPNTDIIQLTKEEFAQLLITPFRNSYDTIVLTITAITKELSNGVTAVNFRFFSVPVVSVAATPDLVVNPAAGVEDNVITIQAATTASDGDSESVLIIIKGVQTGAILSNGKSFIKGGVIFGVTYTEAVWVLSQENLNRLQITPAPHSSDDLNLTFSAIATDILRRELSPTSVNVKIINIPVTPVVDTVFMSFASVRTSEDISVALQFTISLTDTDGSETVSSIVLIDPLGIANFNKGTFNQFQGWIFKLEDLSGLVYTPKKDNADFANFTIFVNVSERNNSKNTRTLIVPWSVDPVVDVPSFNMAKAYSGIEDADINFDIRLNLNDTTNSEEILNIIVKGVPTGAKLNTGVFNSLTNEYSLSSFQIRNSLRVTNIANSDVDYTLTISAIIQDSIRGNNRISNIYTTQLPLIIREQIDGAILDITFTESISGATALTNIAITKPDDDSETFIVIILPPERNSSGYDPEIKFISNGRQFSWGNATFQLNELPKLAILPSINTSNDFELTYTVIGRANNPADSFIMKSAEFFQTIKIVPFISTPSFRIVDNLKIRTTSEDSAIVVPIDIRSHQVPEESLKVIISNLITGSKFNIGVAGEGNTWTIRQDDFAQPGQDVSFAHSAFVAAMANLQFTPAVHQFVPAAMIFTAIAQELKAPNQTNQVSFLHTINVKAVIFTPQLGDFKIINIEEDEFSNLPFNISLYDEQDNTIQSIIVNVPTLDNNRVGIFYFLDAENQKVTLDSVNNSKLTLNRFQIERLYFQPNKDDSRDVTLTVSVNVFEFGQQISKSFGITIPVVVAPVVDVPSLTIFDSLGSEDLAVRLSFIATPNDKDNSETITRIVINGVLSGSQFVKQNGAAIGSFAGGAWTFTKEQIADLFIISPKNFNKPNILTISAVSQELDEITRQIIPASNVFVDLLAVVLNPVADTPTIQSVVKSGGSAFATSSNVQIQFSIASQLQNLSSFTAGARQTETLMILISNFPTGATFSKGTSVLDGTQLNWQFSPADFANITITPPHNFAGVRTIQFTAISKELNNPTNLASSVITKVFTIDPVLLAPSITPTTVITSEDTPVHLQIDAGLADDNESGSVLVVIRGFPSAVKLNFGQSSLINGGVLWTVNRVQLANLNFTPPPHSDPEYSLTVTAFSFNISNPNVSLVKTSNLHVIVAAVADTPTIIAGNTTGKYTIPISINASLLDNLDKSESLFIVFPQLPSNMHYNFSGAPRPTVEFSQLVNAQIIVDSLTPLRQSQVLITAISIDRGLTRASQITSFDFDIIANAQAPILEVFKQTGDEDTAVAIGINFAVANQQDYNSTNITLFTTTPLGSDLSFPEAIGSYTATSAILANGINWTIEFFRPKYNGVFNYYPPRDVSGNISLLFTGLATEGGSQARISALQNFTVRSVFDGPSLIEQEYVLFENSTASLTLGISLTDIDGSETFTKVIITGMNNNLSIVGAQFTTISGGLRKWEISANLLNTLQVQTNSFFDGFMDLTITTFANEIAGAQQTRLFNHKLSVFGISDTPIFIAPDQFIQEDQSVDLGIFISSVDYYLNNGKATESILIFISFDINSPTGSLSKGAFDAVNNRWVLNTEQLSGLIFTPQAHRHENVTLTVSAIVTESNNPNSIVNLKQKVTITIDAVAQTVQLIVSAFSTFEDFNVNIPIKFSMPDTDDSELLQFFISGVNGKLVNNANQAVGVDDGQGNILLEAADLVGLRFIPTRNLGGTQTLVVTAITTEFSNDAQAIISKNMYINLKPQADQGSLVFLNAYQVDEEQKLNFNLDFVFADDDGSESAKVVLSNLPSGVFWDANDDSAKLGTRVGSLWTFAQSEINHLVFQPDKNIAGQFFVQASLITTEKTNPSSSAVLVQGLSLEIRGVADTPTFTGNPITIGFQEGQTRLLAFRIGGRASTESIFAVFDGYPQGVSFSQGFSNFDDGRWTINAADIRTVKILTNENYSGSFNLTVSTIAKEAFGGDTTYFLTTLPIITLGVADTPVIQVAGFTMQEDEVYDWEVSANLYDSNESLSLVIDNLPTGTTLNIGQNAIDAFGDPIPTQWLIEKQNINGLKITPPKNLDIESINLVLTLKSNATTGFASISQLVKFGIAPVSDTATFSKLDNARTNEDVAVRFSLAISLTDTSESLLVFINYFGAEIHNINGISGRNWTFTQAQINAGLFLTPEANGNGDFEFEITARSSELRPNNANITTTEIVRTMSVHVNAVSDLPFFTGTTRSTGISANAFVNLGLNISTINNQEIPDSVVLRASDLENLVVVDKQGNTLAPALGSNFIKINANIFESLQITYKNPSQVTINLTALAYEENPLNLASTLLDVVFSFAGPAVPLVAPPILIDLDGDGAVSMIALNNSEARVDVNGDGVADKIAWVEKNDGLLVADINGDGKIAGANEILIAQNTQESDTDLQALAALYDSNHDGKINKLDDKFNQLKIFQDLNGDGIVQDGEVKSLSDWNINEISVQSDNVQKNLQDGSVIYGSAQYTKTDGSTATILDAGLAYSPVVRTDLVIIPQKLDGMILPVADESALPELKPNNINLIRLKLKSPELFDISFMDEKGKIHAIQVNADGEAMLSENQLSDLAIKPINGKDEPEFLLENITTKLNQMPTNYDAQAQEFYAQLPIFNKIRAGDYFIADIDGENLNYQAKTGDNLRDIYQQWHAQAQNSDIGAITENGLFIAPQKYSQVLAGVVNHQDLTHNEGYWQANGEEFTPPDYQVSAINANNEPIYDHYRDMDLDKNSSTPIWEEQGDYSLEFTGYFDLPLTKNSMLHDEYIVEIESKLRDRHDYEANYGNLDPITGLISDNYSQMANKFTLRDLEHDDSVMVFNRGDGENSIDLMQHDGEKIQLNGYDWADLKVEIVGEDAHISFNNSTDKIMLRNVGVQLAGDKSLTLDDILGKHVEVLKDETNNSSKPKAKQDEIIIHHETDDDLMIYKHEDTHH